MHLSKSVYWYVSKETDRKGIRQITDRVEDAVMVRINGQECPLVAGFYSSSFSVQQLERRKKVWEHLLDLMEKHFEMQDEGDLEGFDALRKQMLGVQEALAMLTYGEINDNALKLIRAQANSRYDEE